MKALLLSIMMALPSVVLADTVTYGGVGSLTSNVGSRLTISVNSVMPSNFTGIFRQSSSYVRTIQSPVPVVNTFTQFNFSSTMNYNINSTINSNTMVFSRGW